MVKKRPACRHAGLRQGRHIVVRNLGWVNDEYDTRKVWNDQLADDVEERCIVEDVRLTIKPSEA